MKLLFINSAYPKDSYSIFKEKAHGILQVPSDVFQWAVIDGLEKNSVDYTLACTPALPAWPRYKNVFTPSGVMCVNGTPRGHYLKYCNIPAIKQVSQRRILRKYAQSWCEQNQAEDSLIILVYTQQTELLGAAIDLKKHFSNLIVVPIVTDLIENAMDFQSNRSLLKKIQVKLEAKAEKGLFPKVDKFVLLTQQMEECIPEARGRSVVMEGIYPIAAGKKFIDKSEKPRMLLYTGVLEDYAGVHLLIDAFRMVKDRNVMLVVCGSGSGSDYVRRASEEDERIDFKGRVEREEAVRLQRESTLLINPRQPNGGITKYSFPSKTMEYLASGTPMIGYRLEGIPEEYFQYMYIPADLSLNALVDCLYSSLSLSQSELQEKAQKAYCFISREKNSEVQVKRIIEFLYKIN